MEIKKYLDDLESRIDEAGEADLIAQWKRFADGGGPEGLFSPRRNYTAPPSVEWPDYSVNEAIADRGKMLLSQLAGCSGAIAHGAGNVLNVRSNYGTGIMSSLFGAEIFMMEDKLNTLPTSIPLPGGADAVRRLVDAGVPDLYTGFGGKALEMGAYYAEEFAPYPKISKYLSVYHPDTQGPVDIAELVWGSAMFYEFVDQPELVHEFLALITETYAKYLRTWLAIAPHAPAIPEGYAPHWGMLHKGAIMLRDDSAMNLSGEMFEEFIRPYDQRLLDEFGGGAIHFCGHGDHFIAPMCSMRNLHGINLSQPHLNDMGHVWRNTVDKGIPMFGFDRGWAERALAEGRDLKRRVQVW